MLIIDSLTYAEYAKKRSIAPDKVLFSSKTFLIFLLQSNLVISNSLISIYQFELSRSKNLVPVLTWNYDNR